MDEIFFSADPTHVKRERAAARELRASQWWKNQLAKGICHYCKKMVGRDNLTMDHVIPVARGGRSTKSNCVPACKECNNKKRAFTPAEQILNQIFPD